MFVCGVVSSSRESIVVPEIFTVLGCFTHHRFVVTYLSDCWTLEGGTDRLVQNVTNYPSTLCNMPEVHRSHLHNGSSMESHICMCVCHTGTWESSGIGLVTLNVC